MLDGAGEITRAGCVWPRARGGNGLDHSYLPLSLRERQLRPCVDGAGHGVDLPHLKEELKTPDAATLICGHSVHKAQNHGAREAYISISARDV
eukprot:2205080-Pleurochrysis_carterae.AAC.1